MADVFFTSIRTDNSLLDDVSRLFDRAFKKILKKDDITAVKIHFGEYGNTGFVKSIFVRRIVEKIEEIGAHPFVTDCNTLYKGMRHNSVDHLTCAMKNGFTHATIDAPIIIADGLHGHSYKEIEINKGHFKKVKIGTDIAESDSMIVISHFKGHMSAGFGGAIKNLGMGCASRAGKQQQHSSSKPNVIPEKCINCRKCSATCPEDAISHDKNYAEIDYKKCVGCDECVTVCPTEAIGLMWDSGGTKDMQEKMAEYAFGATKGKKIGYINFLIDITPDCDCFPRSDAPIVSNIGILASTDPVAIDKAAIDLVNKAEGLSNSRLKDIKSNHKFKSLHGFTNTFQLEYGEKIGLGKLDYNLIKI